MRILVTGGAGFIGSHLIDRLLAEGRQVVCLDSFDHYYSPQVKRANLAPHHQSLDFRLVEGDIRDPRALEAAFAGQPFDRVVHLAAAVGVRPSLQNPALYEEVNLRGTLLLLEAIRSFGAGQLVFASSSSVYGAQQQLPFREDSPADRPLSPYGATKRAGEILCHSLCRLAGVPVTALRFFTVYGPRQRPDMAIHRFARQIQRGEPVTIFGDGNSGRDYTYIDDILQGILAALAHPFPFEIINLGSSAPVPLAQLVSLLEQALGQRAHVVHAPEQPGDVPITYADTSKASRLLGFQPTVSLEQGLANFVSWFRSQPEGELG